MTATRGASRPTWTSWPAPSPSRAAAAWPLSSGRWAPALVTMVTDLTLGKEKYAAVQDEMVEIEARAEKLRARAGRLGHRSTPRPTRAVAAAMKLPQRHRCAEEGARAGSCRPPSRARPRCRSSIAEAARRGGAAVAAGRREGQPQRGVRRRRGRDPGRRGRAVARPSTCKINLAWIEDEGFKQDAWTRIEAVLSETAASARHASWP